MTRSETGMPVHPLGRLAGHLRRFSELTGAAIAWLTLPMVVATFVIALLRYAFALNWIWMQELVVWMHALVFMLAAAYTLNSDEHVRVDIFYRQFSPRRKALVNLCGCLVFLLPLSVMLIVMSLDYVITDFLLSDLNIYSRYYMDIYLDISQLLLFMSLIQTYGILMKYFLVE